MHVTEEIMKGPELQGASLGCWKIRSGLQGVLGAKGSAWGLKGENMVLG